MKKCLSIISDETKLKDYDKEAKMVWQLNLFHDPALDLRFFKKIAINNIGTAGEIWVRAVYYTLILYQHLIS